MRVLAESGKRDCAGIEALGNIDQVDAKGTTAFQNLKFLKNCLVYGVQPVWNLLVGPRQEEEIYLSMHRPALLVHLPPPSARSSHGSTV
jgi:magnesium-protoporphyrin IX monomethyl ester (oxidative) cyclase